MATMAVALMSPPEAGQLVSVRSRDRSVSEVVPSSLPSRGLEGIDVGFDRRLQVAALLAQSSDFRSQFLKTMQEAALAL
jgi:hypothetical protein